MQQAKHSEETAHLDTQHVRILYVEDIPDHAELISAFISRMGEWVEVDVAASVEAGIKKLMEEHFDLLLSDFRIGPIDCFSLLNELSEKGVSLPVIILTGEGNEEVAAEAISQGASDYLIKDGVFREPSRLFQAIRSSIERARLEEALKESEEKYRSLVQNIQDGVFILRGTKLEFVNPAFAELLGVTVEGLEGEDFISLFAPDQINNLEEFVKASMADDTAIEAEFILEGKPDKRAIYVTLNLSNCTFIGEPALIGTVKDVTSKKITERKLQETLSKLEKLSITDDLTSLFNRRHVLSAAENEVLRSQRYHTPLSLIMLDVDNFKEINDRYGHTCGDEVLISLATTLREALREIDTVARYGGDEFIIILPQTDSQSALRIAERIRSKVEVSFLPSPTGQYISFTISLGITELQDEKDSLNELIKRADSALLATKSKGRNSVEIVL